MDVLDRCMDGWMEVGMEDGEGAGGWLGAWVGWRDCQFLSGAPSLEGPLSMGISLLPSPLPSPGLW